MPISSRRNARDATPRRFRRSWGIAGDIALGLIGFGLIVLATAGISQHGQPSFLGSSDRLPIAGTLIDRGMLASRDVFILGPGKSMVAAPPVQTPPPAGVLERTSLPTAIFILAGAFAAIVAFNLWFLRHLGRVYASSRPGGGRRG